MTAKAARVFVVQQPTRRNAETGEIEHSMNLRPASEYGRLITVLPDNENPFRNIEDTVRKIRKTLSTHAYGPADYLLLVGNPILIGLTCAVASDFHPTIKFLQWQRARHSYDLVTVPDIDVGADT